MKLAPFSPVADWLAVPTSGYAGTFRNLVTGSDASVTRTTPKTVFDAGAIHDVPAGSLAVRPRQDGKRGHEAVIEEARTNLLLQSTFADSAALATWEADAGLTPTLQESGVYDRDVSLAADGSNRAFWRTITVTAASRTISAYARRPDGEAVTSADIQACAAAGTTTPVGTLLTTTFDDLGGGLYRARATYTGTAATWAVGFAVKAGRTVLLGAPQDELGAFPTSYIPTTTAAVTRNADVVTVPTTGWAVGDMTALLNTTPLVSGTGAFYKLSIPGTSGNANRLLLGAASNGVQPQFLYYGAAGTAVVALATAGTIGETQTFGGRVGGTQSVAFRNGVGGSPVTINAGSAIASLAYIGSIHGTSNFASGPISRLTVYAAALSDAQVAEVTDAVKDGPIPTFASVDFPLVVEAYASSEAHITAVGSCGAAYERGTGGSFVSVDFPLVVEAEAAQSAEAHISAVGSCDASYVGVWKLIEPEHADDTYLDATAEVGVSYQYRVTDDNGTVVLSEVVVRVPVANVEAHIVAVGACGASWRKVAVSEAHLVAIGSCEARQGARAILIHRTALRGRDGRLTALKGRDDRKTRLGGRVDGDS